MCGDMSISPDKVSRLCARVEAPHWAGALKPEAASMMIRQGHLRAYDLRALDAFLREHSAVTGRFGTLELSHLLAGWSLARLHGLRRGMWSVFEQSPLLRDLDVYIAQRWRSTVQKPASSKSRARQLSVAPSELPASWQTAFERMREGLPGHADRGGRCQAAPVPSMVTTTLTKACEFILAARHAGVLEDMTIEAATSYERSLFARKRPLSPVTIKSAIRQISGFARYIGASEEVIEHLTHRVRYHERRAARYTPLKETKVLALPSYEDIFGMALDLLGQAEITSHPKRAQSKRNSAVAITLFCAFPFRVADTAMRFGEEILWDGTGYRFDLVLSKNRMPFAAPIQPVLGFFIDQLILQGAGVEHLHDLRETCFRQKRPLFVTYDGSKPHPRYVSYVWARVLGTGNHAARTKLHDEFARLGSRGVELAMRACGQRSEKTAEAYRTRAFQMLSIDRGHTDMIGEITQEEWEAFF